jgi:tRNA(adenine34) deaminase
MKGVYMTTELITEADVAWMRLALAEAELALEKGNLPIGAVIVRGQEVIARGHNEVESGLSDLKHAEMQAIAKAETFLYGHKRECELYTTLEPCAMCFGAIVGFHFKRVVYAASDTLVNARPLIEHSAYYRRRGPVMVGGCLAQEASALLNTYVERTGGRSHLLRQAEPDS